MLAISCPVFAQEFEPGVVDPFQSQLPVTLWTQNDAASSAELLRSYIPSQNLAINRLRVLVALSQSFPILESDASNLINSARLNMLINHGVMDAAEALAQTMTWYSPEIRREVETISLLTTRPDRYCGRLLAKQIVEIEQGIYIYCLVRSNKWQDAIDIFNATSENITENRRTTLQRFLELDGENNPILDEAWESLPAPFDFIMDEAFGRPRGEAPMPPSYIYYAREIGSTPIAELEFTESLTRWGSLPENVLFATYRNYNRNSNNKANIRSDIVSKITNIDSTNLPSDFENLLSEAINQFSDANLLHAFASQIAPVFAKIDISKISNNSTRNEIIRLGVLGGWSNRDWAPLIARDDFPLVMAFALRHKDVDFDDLLNTNLPTKQALIIHQVFFANILKVEELPKNEDKKTAGEEIMRALDIIDNFLTHEDAQVVQAFQVLMLSGQSQFARDIAINMLFGGATP